jgi:hypothetical protein
MGLDLVFSRVIVLTSQQHPSPTMDELCQVLQAKAGRQAHCRKEVNQLHNCSQVIVLSSF